ncbi:cytochrome P450 315a1, mitochondrial [Leptidea sinapis]|uniref:cytochrome P450 315a1, mitochondrial n=1 Tax=Leptidea sinapis TaxID=189913 RepID=UPI002127E294|nr:cytochrome P450 315a1, mitochondrial [Leptidea sinapis]XP_050680018.1 cytochrome P450 315a1, mitochondrial [Leptidea sinapis]XP_050680019.1 cytochrome P450 315a1, mitochondrial [Leptidea sinapis]
MIRKFSSKQLRSVIGRQENKLKSLSEMPRPTSLPIIGTKIDLFMRGRGTRIHEYVDERHKNLGKIFTEKFGTTDLIFISDAELIKTLFMNLEGKYPMHILPDPWVLYEKLYGCQRGLLFMNGEEWLSNRRLMNKHLLRDGAELTLREPIVNTIEKFIDSWKRKVKNNEEIIDISSEFYKLSINVLINILMGTNIPTPSRHYDELLLKFSSSVKDIFETTTKLYGLPINLCQQLNLKLWRDFKECVDLSLLLGNKLVTEMLHLQKKGNYNGLLNKIIDENMDEKTISRILTDFIMAAGDTTAYTSMWILYLLSDNISEISEIRRKKQSYIQFVIKEAMRLYPVAPFLTRILPKNCCLGGFEVHQGTPIIASIYTSGRDDGYFSKPCEFLPFRWDRNDLRRENLVNHKASASLPFALGARSCIGKKIAIVQLTELVWQIVDNFDFKCTNTDNIKAITSQALVPNKKIGIKLTLRNKT